MKKLVISLLSMVCLIGMFMLGIYSHKVYLRVMPKPVLPKHDYALWKLINTNENGTLNLAKLGSQAWTKVCFLGPYNEDSAGLLGFDWNIKDYTKALRFDGHNVLIFASNEHVIDFIVQPRSHGDFAELSGTCLARENSTLVSSTQSHSYKHRN
ncbi:hypothetical protein SNR37_004098 [Agarivorans aestuarii]|uniref:Uncharacterized protein n=1 Tax=Agarivorans aestuarii TaxID=1563703 RepID=A0ABU7G5U2_9ALTE|nr:hypothetical protein [Agarivorans aestuarii]MEE1674655.1 hypothetical protein [Agarivorans aestuarii]